LGLRTYTKFEKVGMIDTVAERSKKTSGRGEEMEGHYGAFSRENLGGKRMRPRLGMMDTKYMKVGSHRRSKKRRYYRRKGRAVSENGKKFS